MKSCLQEDPENAVVLHFSLEYFTKPDESVAINLENFHDRELIAGNYADMQSKGNGQWTFDALLAAEADRVDYRFSIKRNGRTMVEEQRGFLHHWLIGARKEVYLKCFWLGAHGKDFLYSSAFTTCIFPDGNLKKRSRNQKYNVVLVVSEFVVPKGQELCLTGNQAVLGNWQVYKALPLSRSGSYSWQMELSAETLLFPLEYKFILRDQKTSAAIWETGDNRFLDGLSIEQETVVEHPALRLPQLEVKEAGVVMPLFSLRSNGSWGVGDFGDLKKMLTWMAKVKLHVLQILPVNDTTRTGSWADSYPYSGISVFALHPMYVDLNVLKPLENKQLTETFEEKRKVLNALPQMDYEAVNRLKNAYLEAYYQQEKSRITTSEAFLEFRKAQEEWLLPYCYFRCLQHYFGTSDFRRWPLFNKYNEQGLRTWIETEGRRDEVNYYAFVQYLLYSQLRDVHEYARRKGVILKGDIPIGVSRDSATAWRTPDYFNFDAQAGAPPDYFSENGQNWGFPTYNWKAISEDRGRWWHKRLNMMASYFDAYRIDHVLGFFRIWEIPYEYHTGMLGHFNPALPLSPEEIAQCGFGASVEEFTKAQFADPEMEKLFGPTDCVEAKNYFSLNEAGKWQLKKVYLSQRAIEAQTKPGNLRDGLLRAVTNVLFLRDKENKRRYHINIGGKSTFAYSRLEEKDRKAYDALFDDFFYHRHDEFWANGAREKLRFLTENSSMLPCAEDLGMIPACMRTVLNELQVLSLEVETMPKYSWQSFADVMQNPKLSVDTITTHDMAPLRLWWKRCPAKAQEYFNNILHREGKAPQELSGVLCEEIVRRHLESPSLLCIIAWQDWLGMDEKLRSQHPESEQINNPADPHQYWRYRMECTIEQLAENKQFEQKIISLLEETAR